MRCALTFSPGSGLGGSRRQRPRHPPASGQEPLRLTRLSGKLQAEGLAESRWSRPPMSRFTAWSPGSSSCNPDLPVGRLRPCQRPRAARPRPPRSPASPSPPARDAQDRRRPAGRRHRGQARRRVSAQRAGRVRRLGDRRGLLRPTLRATIRPRASPPPTCSSATRVSSTRSRRSTMPRSGEAEPRTHCKPRRACYCAITRPLLSTRIPDHAAAGTQRGPGRQMLLPRAPVRRCRPPRCQGTSADKTRTRKQTARRR